MNPKSQEIVVDLVIKKFNKTIVFGSYKSKYQILRNTEYEEINSPISIDPGKQSTVVDDHNNNARSRER